MKFYLENNMKKTKNILRVLVLLFVFSFNLQAQPGEHENDPIDNRKDNPYSNRKVNPGGQEELDGGCGVERGDIANFANGEKFNFQSVVSYVAKSGCSPQRLPILRQELQEGIRFNHTPFRFDDIAKNYTGLTTEERKRVEYSIYDKMNSQMTLTPMSGKDLLPILGQLALLSPKAARSTLAYIITQELISQEMKGNSSSNGTRDISSNIETVSMLARLGANEPLIIQELSAQVEEMATTSQADSLGKILTGLALAAREADQFATTFNSSAGAFSRAIKDSSENYSAEERSNLLKAGFKIADASAGYSPSIEPGAQEINEALGVLLKGDKLDETVLKNFWRKVVDVTSASSGQTALAQALALSISSDVIFLPKVDREKMLSCAKTHPAVAFAIQRAFLEGWEESNRQVLKKKMRITAFNEKRQKFFEPWVVGLLGLEANLIEPVWLAETVKKGLIKDEDVQTKFPRLVLSLLEKQEQIGKDVLLVERQDRWLASYVNSFDVLWSLNETYLPALEKWSKKHADE